MTTWAPAAGLSGGAVLVLSDGDLTARNSGASNSTAHIRANQPVSGAKVYFETRFISVPGVRYGAIGLIDAEIPLPTVNGNLAPGTWVLCDDGKVSGNGGNLQPALPAAFVNGDVAMVMVDLALGRVWVGRNGVWLGNPVAGTGWAMSGLPAQVYAKATVFSYQASSSVQTVNFGATPFVYGVPAGAVAYADAVTAPPLPYANPRPNPWPTLTNIQEDTFTTTPAPVNLPMVFSGPVGLAMPYAVVGESLPMMGCLPGDIIDARWSQEFTNNMTGPEKLCECSGVLMLERITDPTTPIAIYNAGPLVDFRCMSENRGANVANNPQHHIEITWDGQTLVQVAGNYVVRARAYASPGDNITPAPGTVIFVHDGDLIVSRKRSLAA